MIRLFHKIGPFSHLDPFITADDLRRTSLQSTCPKARLLRRLYICVSGVACVFGLCQGGASLKAQEPPAASPQQGESRIAVFPAEKAAASAPAKPVIKKLTVEEAAAIDGVIESLASPVFAKRERAAEALLAKGQRVVPRLRKRLAVADDPEVRLRAKTLITQLQDGDFEAKVEAFLDGEDVGFEGWPIFRIMFRESGRSRDIFVALLRDYPELVSSMHGTPRDRALAMEPILNQIETKLSTPSARLTIADGIAMLLPASDRDVPLTNDFEKKMMLVLGLNPISKAQDDPFVGTAFTELMNAWVRRSSLENRIRIMHMAMERDLYTVYPLALKTLDESTDQRQLAGAMQVISRFGREQDQTVVAKFLDDERTLSTLLFQRGHQTRTILGDAAMATIAKLHDVPLTELGFPASAEHEKFGFVYEQLLFIDVKRPAATVRKEARQKVDQLLKTGVVPVKEKQKS